MSDLVDPTEIERIVGVKRHPVDHFGRAVSAERMIYILHSAQCRNSGRDLRTCAFSLALDKGIQESDWAGVTDRPALLEISLDGRLIPAISGENQ